MLSKFGVTQITCLAGRLSNSGVMQIMCLTRLLSKFGVTEITCLAGQLLSVHHVVCAVFLFPWEPFGSHWGDVNDVFEQDTF